MMRARSCPSEGSRCRLDEPMHAATRRAGRLLEPNIKLSYLSGVSYRGLRHRRFTSDRVRQLKFDTIVTFTTGSTMDLYSAPLVPYSFTHNTARQTQLTHFEFEDMPHAFRSLPCAARGGDFALQGFFHMGLCARGHTREGQMRVRAKDATGFLLRWIPPSCRGGPGRGREGNARKPTGRRSIRRACGCPWRWACGRCRPTYSPLEVCGIYCVIWPQS